ncbi:MAG TPA: ABC transporter ATP-binding protein [Candidatus Acidoferrales bacterium]|jgi:ATP-binding cassette subfamily B multidrug efflux pump|nr:ABC transporter ATP-binding protein [Candidatus Acidoferrales bacterium]
MAQEEEVLGKAYDSRLMKRLLTYLRPYWWQTAVALTSILLKVVLGPDVIGPFLTATVIDKYLSFGGNKHHWFLDRWLSPNPWIGIGQIAGIYLASLLFNFVLEFVQTYLMQWTGQMVMFDLRSHIFRHLQQMHVAFFDKNPVGRLVTRVTSDVDALNEMFTAGVVSIFEDVFVLGGIMFVMLRMKWWLALITFAVLPLIFWVTMIFRRSVRESYRRIRVAIARINAYLQEHVTGMVVLQLFNRERRAYKKFDRINAQHMEAFKDAIWAYAIYYPVVELLSTIAIASALWFGGLKVFVGTVTLGTITAFIQYAQRFFRPIQDLSEKYNILQSAMASAERVFKLLDTPVEIFSPDAPKNAEGRGRIEFDHVWFAYRRLEDQNADDAGESLSVNAAEQNGHPHADGSGFDWVLRDVSFAIEPGESVAIVGHTGAGKTTIISLLMRFYDIQKGAIRIDGIDIRNMDLADLRRRFGVVLQDPFLFSGTIENNIRLGSKWITDEQVETAAENVNVADFIRTLPHGFKEPVLERGSTLSTGQKQLISFARALAHNPKILVLDEATSSVDTETELRVRDALTRMVEGRTSVIIAHRLSTIQRADKIIVMHKGHVREIGSHQELLAQRGIYWKLYQLQYKDQELNVGEPQVSADD